MQEISIISVICVIFSALVSVFVPILFLIVSKCRMKGSLRAVLWAVLTYIVVFVLQALLWSIPDMDNVLTVLLGELDSEAIITAIECVFMALVETAVLWLFFLLKRKKYTEPGSTLMFGSAYAIVDCLIYSILLVLSVLVIIQNACGNGEITYTFGKMSVSASKINRGGATFLVYGLRSLFDFMFITSAAMLLFQSVRFGTKWQIPVVFFLDIFHVLPASFSELNIWYWGNTIVVMIGLGVVAVISVLIAYAAYLSYYRREIQEKRAQKKTAQKKNRLRRDRKKKQRLQQKSAQTEKKEQKRLAKEKQRNELLERREKREQEEKQKK